MKRKWKDEKCDACNSTGKSKYRSVCATCNGSGIRRTQLFLCIGGPYRGEWITWELARHNDYYQFNNGSRSNETLSAIWVYKSLISNV